MRRPGRNHAAAFKATVAVAALKAAAKPGIASYLAFYNTRCPHSSLAGRTPDTAYFGNTQFKEAA